MSCATVPTETQFQVVTTTSDSLSTSFSAVVTTLPPTVTSTIVCLGSSSNSACSAATLTFTASTSTTSVPVTVTVPVTFTNSSPTRTLFSTSCSSSSTSTSSTSSSSNILTSQSSQPTPTLIPTSSQSSTSSTSVSASPPLVSSSSVITSLSNGTFVTTQVVVTTTSSPSSVVVTPTTPSSDHSGSGGGNSTSKIAPITGGVVGGVVAVLTIIGIIWYIRRRSKRWNDMVEKDEVESKHRPRMSIGGEDVQPRPYHYGLVGHSSSPSPPNSPSLGAVGRGHSPSNSLSILNAPPQHSRSSSGVTPSSPPSMTRSLSDLSSANPTLPQSSLARPSLSIASSAGASARPLLERPVNHTRSPSIPTAALLSDGRSQQHVPLSHRPHSAGGSLQSASPPAPATSTGSVTHPQTSSLREKRRLLASLPQGAAAPTPPSLAVESGSSPVQFPHAESHAPPIRPRNPSRPSSAKSSNVVTVHVDGGPAAESEHSRPEGNEPPAYTPT